MDELLSLKWKNHCSTFLHILSFLRKEQSYSDVTLACSGKFYSAHKMVLTACSDYFKEIFEHTDCKKPVIVLKGINCEDLEVLLDYMYIGEVNVKQSDITSLIKAAECLQIKGLAVADDEPVKETRVSSKRISSSPSVKSKRKSNESHSHSSESKHFKLDTKMSSISEDKNYDRIEKVEHLIDKDEPIFIKEEIDNSFGEMPLEEPEFIEQDNRLQSLHEEDSNSKSYVGQPHSSQGQESHIERRLSDPNPSFQDGPEWQEGDVPFSPFSDYSSTVEVTTQGETSKEKSTRCHICFKSFTYQSSLKMHIRIHTGEKPFSCPFCDRTGNTKGNLRSHIRTVHKSHVEPVHRNKNH